MKNVLLATTALVFTAGFAAAEVTTSATAKLTYGNYGEGKKAGTLRSFSQEADVDFTMSGEASGIAYTAGLELDENGEGAAAITMSSAGFTFVYDANSLSDITEADATTGEDNDLADWKVSYANGGITGSYAADRDSDAYVATAGYAAGALALGLETDGTTNEVSIGYTMGNIAIAVSGADDDTWDASLAYTMGETVVTVGTDEIESHYAKVATNLNGLSLTARYEVDGNTADDTAETEVSVGYTMGDITVAVAYDSGQAGKFGDEAETTLVVDYDLGGIALQLKANDQEEMEASAAFTF